MARYRQNLPQLGGDLFLADGGIETTLIFLEGHELPHFAAFDLLRRPGGRTALEKYFRTYARIATQHGVGLVLESATWRASPDWAAKLGYTPTDLADANLAALDLLHAIRQDCERGPTRIVLSGCIGPRGDGYRPEALMSEAEAEDYHAVQAGLFRDAEADLVTAITMTYPAEAIGLARAARAAGMPVVISFTTETDGRLPTGETLREAVERVDEATGGAPAYYMVNCAHPTHFAGALPGGEAWVERIRGLRANASTRSHAELDEATDLDDGDPVQLAREYRALGDRLPSLNVLGGCCGTDHRHIEAICRTWLAA